jgi:hypothetical protein
LNLERRTAAKCCLISFLGSLVPVTLMAMAAAGVVLQVKPGRPAVWFYSVNSAVSLLELAFSVRWLRVWFPRLRRCRKCRKVLEDGVNTSPQHAGVCCICEGH